MSKKISVLLESILVLSFVLTACSPANTTVAPTPAMTQPSEATSIPAGEPTATAVLAITDTILPTEQPAATGLNDTEKAQAAQVLHTACVVCHSLDKVTHEHGDLAQWQSTVSSMQQKGAAVSDADADLLSRYLAEQYP